MRCRRQKVLQLSCFEYNQEDLNIDFEEERAENTSLVDSRNDIDGGRQYVWMNDAVNDRASCLSLSMSARRHR